MTPAKVPPLDGSLDLTQIIDFFLDTSPEHVYATLAPPSGTGDLIDVTWPELARAIHRGAHIVNPILDGRSKIGTGNVVCIYAVADNLLYATLILAIIRSGNIVCD